MANFTITISDEKENYNVIQFLHILAKAINACESGSATDTTSDDGKWYTFDASDFTEEQCNALSRILVDIYNRPDIAVQIQ